MSARRLNMTTATVTGRVSKDLRTQIADIAKAEKRTVSNVVEMALESFVRQYTELHPQFKVEILAGLEQMDAGEIVPYERG
jgi:predicted transcriptional regulator